MSMVFGAEGLGSMRSRRARVFPDDQMLIGIEDRVFDDLADLETESNRGEWGRMFTYDMHVARSRCPRAAKAKSCNHTLSYYDSRPH